MKKITTSLAIMAGAMLFASCGTTGGSVAQGVGQTILNNAINGNGTTNSNSSSDATNTGTTILGSLLGNLLGTSSNLSQKSIEGTWNYSGANCVFESENLLAKAGGAVAANKIENEINTQLAKVGIKNGACSFTFNSDNTYTANIGGRTISGNYTLDTKNKKMKLTYLAGLAQMTPHVAMQNGQLCLLMEGDKMLKLLKGVSALSKSSSMGAVSSILSNYSGMYVGMKLSR